MARDTLGPGVFLLAENRLFLDVLARLLARRSDICVVGVAAISDHLISEVEAANPDVILCDSPILSSSKHCLAVDLRRSLPNARILLFEMEFNHQAFLIAVRNGIAGYLLKDASAAQIGNAIVAVARGEAVCPPALCSVLFDHVANSGPSHSRFQSRNDLGLTKRENQIVQLVSEGLTNKEIAARLGLSEQTIKNQVSRMLRKAGATDRLEAVERWRAQGFWT